MTYSICSVVQIGFIVFQFRRIFSRDIRTWFLSNENTSVLTLHTENQVLDENRCQSFIASIGLDENRSVPEMASSDWLSVLL